MRPEEIIERGRQAKELIDNKLVKQALDGMRQTLIVNLETSPWYNFKERQEIYRQLKTIAHFKKQFKAWVEDSKAQQLKLDNKLRKVV